MYQPWNICDPLKMRIFAKGMLKKKRIQMKLKKVYLDAFFKFLIMISIRGAVKKGNLNDRLISNIIVHPRCMFAL
jgi:hypothetical protein